MKFLAFCLLVAVVPSWATYVPGVKTTEDFSNSEFLDSAGNYILFWNYNDTYITFEVHVKTKGWVGFGISDNGNMFPSDVVIGWVSDDGVTHFDDRHATGHRLPVKDSSQDWHLLFSEENEFGTVLKFTRKINTCDPNDKVISDDTVRLIYAYNDKDPVTENHILYHGTNRGTKSLSLLSSNVAVATLPSDVKYFDFLNKNYIMPSDDTTYYCRGFRMPKIGKHHMVMYEPVITPGNELNVHHILLRRCDGADPAISDGASWNCYHNQPREVQHCDMIIIAWAIGGTAFYFPDNIGFSFGGPDDGSFYIMETHYDNPTRLSGVIDNSGLRIAITPTLRPIEAGMLELGQAVTWSQVVPPNRSNFVSAGFCSESCIRDSFTQNNLTEIKVFGVLQHAHLLGREIRTRHFRNGTELPPIMDDQNYDFNFQQTRLLPKDVSIHPGDSITVECVYDSTGRTGATFGGLSTSEEMCLTLAYYYPRTGFTNCLTAPVFDTFGIKGNAEYDQMHSRFQTMDWSNTTLVSTVEDNLAHSTLYQRCAGFQSTINPYIKPAERDVPYIPPTNVCS